ncbi:MAG: two-component sensor histidine kinase, partial [Leifsonia sp.]|nr:two-component sensor histidine kinase [Leifsonia sp.]
DGSRNRATGSTGLGLAIVDAVVQAHGGDVAVRSEPGNTVFTVSLPLLPAAADNAAEAGSEVAPEPDLREAPRIP